MHGVDKKKVGRPKGVLNKNVKWHPPAYAALWVKTHFLAYVHRRVNYDYKRRPPERQLKIRPTLQSGCKDCRPERVCPRCRSCLRRFYEADEMMKKLQRDGDRIYALYENALKLIIEAFERVVDEGRAFDYDELMSYGFDRV